MKTESIGLAPECSAALLPIQASVSVVTTILHTTNSKAWTVVVSTMGLEAPLTIWIFISNLTLFKTWHINTITEEQASRLFSIGKS